MLPPIRSMISWQIERPSPVPCAPSFFKAVENGTLLFQWDSATGVGDGEERKFFRFLTDFQRDTSLRGELRGVDQ